MEGGPGMEFDAIVVGGGTNGLCAAAYLSRRSLRVLLLERMERLGGAAITEEATLPGFRHDLLATSLNLWRVGDIAEELELSRYGYREALPDPVAASPFPGGRTVTIHRDLERTVRSIERFSSHDARRFREVYEYYRTIREFVIPSLYAAPASLASSMAVLEGSPEGLEFLQFTYRSTRDWVEETFESEEVRAFFTLWSSNHLPLSPETAGSALVSLLFVGILQEKGCAVPLGGIRALPDALRRYVEAHGGTVRLRAPVATIRVREGRATGVRLADGEEFSARHGIVANVEPRHLFLDLVGSELLPPDFVAAVRKFRYSRVAQVMVHAALSGPPGFDRDELQNAGIVQLGDSLDEVSGAFSQCVRGIPPDRPFLTVDNTSGYDPSRAPPGQHTLWCFARAPVYPGGAPWTPSDLDAFADRCLARIEEHAPGLSRRIRARLLLSPQDIERINPNIVNGDPGGGAATVDQLLQLRPFPGWSRYRTPLKGLYMCGPATHPGGGISGASGHNAAHALLEDLASGGSGKEPLQEG